MNQFLTLTTAQINASEATTPDTQTLTMIETVISVNFNGVMQAKAQFVENEPNNNSSTWCSRIVDVALNGETQSAFNAKIEASLTANNASALVRITVDGKSISREIRATNDELKTYDKPLRLRIPPSATPRSFLRIHLWAEAQTLATNGEALAVIDTLDVTNNLR